MKLTEAIKTKEILNNYYQNSKMPVWVYDRNGGLKFTNFTNAVLLHLMDAIEPIVSTYQKEASYLDFMKLYGSDNEAYLCFQFPIDRRHFYTVVVGPALLTYPSEEIWEDLLFHKHVWSNRREETLKTIPIVTLEAFLLNARFIMQTFGIYHLNPLEIADTHPMTNFYYEEAANFNLLTGQLRTDFYSVKQAHEAENELSFHIEKGNADRVDEILMQRDRVSLLLPAESHRENFIYAIALLSIGRNASIRGGMRPEAAYALFHSYSIQLQSCHQMLEFFRLTHNALCAFAEGVQSVATQMLDQYSDMIRSCIRLIYARMPGRITVEELSEEVHLTPKYLSSLFVKETGSSLTQFIGKIRIEQACYMLSSTPLSYLEISNILEFSSQSHFTAAFRKSVGLTPREYRLKNQKFSTKTERGVI
ncbi:MAG: AraC family transcriptional regulator [Lachnospiraceae bacterium]|nr:AraC family transcriptional regulator [Lachnospiraceae bacterium]